MPPTTIRPNALHAVSSPKCILTVRLRRNESRPKVHVGSSNPKRMEDWKPLDFTGDEEAVVGEQPPMPEGLETDAATLQALFESSNDHLADVRQRHTEVLITAGMLPESGLAEHHPERALAWVVEGINGRLNPDGLTVPLLGTHEDAIQLHVKQTEEATLVRLDIEDSEGPNLVRELPLPAEAASTLAANFTNGRLTLRW